MAEWFNLKPFLGEEEQKMSLASVGNGSTPENRRTDAIAKFCKRWRVDDFVHYDARVVAGLEQTAVTDGHVDVLLRFASKGRWRLFDLAVMRAELETLFAAPVYLLSRDGLDISRNRYRRDTVWDPGSRDRDAEYMTDILNSAKLAVDYLAGMEQACFADNIQCQDAVRHRLEIMGEAAARLSESARSTFPKLLWDGLINVRDILRIQHDALELTATWESVRQDLPVLIRALEQRLEERN